MIIMIITYACYQNLPQELLPDAVPELREYLSYPLEDTLAADASSEVV